MTIEHVESAAELSERVGCLGLAKPISQYTVTEMEKRTGSSHESVAVVSMISPFSAQFCQFHQFSTQPLHQCNFFFIRHVLD